ncbi:LysR substrate-binding domain-containing protein [Streptomyces katrae]|uniref:LysR substrate-binding domain-containing protein n=1 Tax=Streptomyces katrae TaxID=68223 RepID=UPI0006926094|nr:LysR substrate-binding domain-containing protein [Streptomyces katrae]
MLWLPGAEPDLTVGPTLLTGGRVLAVAADHPLAERGTAPLEDLGDNHVVDFGPHAPEYWVTAVVPTRTPLGRRIPRGPAARTLHEVFSLVASGQCVHPLGEIAARYNRPPDIVFLLIDDAPTIHWALTWRSTADGPTLGALAQTAADVAPLSLRQRMTGS